MEISHSDDAKVAILLYSLTEAVKRKNENVDRYLNKLVSSENTDLWDKIIEVINDHGYVFKVTVDYDFPLAGAIAVGRYGWVDERITEDNFPLLKKRRKKGKREVILKIFYFEPRDGRYGHRTLIKTMKKEGYYPANLQELLMFGELYPDWQKNCSVMALGQRTKDMLSRHWIKCLYPKLSYESKGYGPEPKRCVTLGRDANAYLAVRG